MSELWTKALLESTDKATISTNAMTDFGVVIDPDNLTKAQMIEKFLAAQAEFHGIDSEGTPSTDGSPPDDATDTEVEKPKMFELTIFPGGANETGDVFVSHNNSDYLIKRDKKVKVPWGVIQVLKDAVVTKFERDSDDEMKERNMPRYNIDYREVA